MLKNSVSIEKLFLYTFYILLLGKFYYVLYGWHNHLQPNAPYYVVLIKDTIYALFVILVIKYSIFDKDNYINRVFLLFMFMFTFISILHLINIDSIDWLHYIFRNSLMYIFIILFSFLYIKNFNIFLNAIAYIAILSTLVSVYGFIFDKSILFNGRGIGLQDNPNTFAGVLLFAFIAVYVKNTYNKKFRYIIAMLLFLVGILLSQSITYLVLIVFFLFIYNFTSIKRFYKNRYFIVMLSLMAFALVGIAVNFYWEYIADLYNKIDMILNNPTEINTVTQRLENYNILFDMIKNEKIIELFLGNVTYQRFLKFDSMYLVLWVNFGLLGLILYLTPFFLLLFKKVKYRLSSIEKVYYEIIIFSIIIFLISGLVRNVFNRFPLNIIIYMEIGYLLKLIYYDRYVLGIKGGK